MRNRIFFTSGVAALAALLLLARPAPVSGTAGGGSAVAPAPNPRAACSVGAYVTDTDPRGLNVRDAPGPAGKVVAVIPLDGDGTTVRLVNSSPNGWVQIDRAETVEGNVVLERKGWVSGNMLGISTRGYGTKGVKLYGAGRKVVGTIPPEAEVRVAGCEGTRMRVRYKSLVGWLDRDAQCPNPVTNCS